MDVGSMMQKLEKSEKSREEIEQKLMQQDIKMGNGLIRLALIGGFIMLGSLQAAPSFDIYAASISL